MSARREALEKSAEQESENTDPDFTVDCLHVDNHTEDTEDNQTIDVVPIIETPDGYTDNTFEASYLDEDYDWLSQAD
uniref:Uncharacterized protein n=1 Tax=Anopheles funestus TaxID=62324 RepID=A0A4Y0BFN6_ANOFN